MSASHLGIFIPSLDSALKDSIKELWKGVQIKNMAPIFNGLVIFDLSLKYENPPDFDEFKNDNSQLNQQLILLSEKHPKEAIVLIELYEHGDLPSYQGLVYKAGVLLLNEMGDFNFIFKKFQTEFEEQKIDWWKFYDQRLNALTSFLGLEGSQDDLFESCYTD